MKKIFLFFAALFSLSAINYSLFAHTALAVCPACTIAVAGGLGLSRFLGVDDTISGVWIGALLLSFSLLFFNWLIKKYPKLNFLYCKLIVMVLTYALVIVPLAWADIIGHPLNRLWGIDKLILGTIAGSLTFWFSLWLDKKVRQIKGRQFFLYQKVVFPITLLLISSVVLWIIIKSY